MKNEFKLSIILTFFLLVPIVFALNNYDEQYALLNSTLENLDPSIDLNVSYTFPDSKVSGSCTMYCIENCTQYVFVPASSKVNATAKYKGDCVNETAEEWIQDSSKQTVAGGYAYIKGKLKLCNNASTTFTSVLYNNSLNETVCRDGWFCEVLEGTLDLSPGCSLTDYVVFSNKSNVITKSEGAWNQNTSVISSLLEQYVYKRVYGTNTDPLVSYSNVYWEITPVKWDCIVCSGYFDVSASGSWEANASAKGDNLDEKEAEDWVQDTYKATVAGGYAYIKGKVAAINNAGVDFTNIYFDSSVVSAESRPGWNCSIQSGYIESCTASSCVDNDHSIFCNASNIITRDPLPAIINTTDIIVGVSYDATYNITVNNTDTIPYIEVYVDTSPLENCWAPKVSEVYVDVPALTATNVSVDASGYPVIEKNSSNYVVATTATYVYYEYKAFLNVRAYDAANHKIIYKVSKSLLSNWDKRDESLDTYIIDGKSTGFSTFETDTEIIFEIPTTFSSSSLEYGEHKVIIKYYVPSGTGPGTAPAGGGGGPVITVAPPKFSVFPSEIYLELNKTECTCLLYTSPSPRDLSTSRMPSSA